MTDARPIDIAIIGGGLAGGLIALALHATRPELRVVIVESGARAGGNHIWSCFEQDIAPAHRWLVAPLTAHCWGSHEVRFPGERPRELPFSYGSLTSDRLDAVLRATLPPANMLFGAPVTALTPTSATLADGRIIEADAIIDARGPGDMTALDLGYQKFVGQGWRCQEPHGLAHPIIMDARVEQDEGYRFVYVLPFSATELFIEDTYYTQGPALDVARLGKRIAAYAGRQGWSGAASGHAETGVLPVCMGGSIDALWQAESPGVARVGLRGGFFHAMTGYSLPDAVRVAMAVSTMTDLTGPALHDRLFAMAQAHWRGQGFYRLLATMLFRAADPAERWRILARFYRLDPGLIGRFYAGQSTLFDKLRILTGKPPVPIGRAIEALGAGRGVAA